MSRFFAFVVFIGLFVLGTAMLPASAQVQWSGNGHFYRAVSAPDSITWNQANVAAQEAGGYLATVPTAAENAFVFSLVDAPQYWGFDGNSLGPYLGGVQAPNSSEPGGGWQWITGETWSFTNWASGEPTNGVGSPHGMMEDKLHFFGNGLNRTAQWNDFPAAQPGAKGYVIEFDTDPAAFLTVSGTITLQGTQNSIQPITFTLQPSIGSVFTRTVTLGATGFYLLPNIPPNLYTVSIKGARWLETRITVDTRFGSVTNANATLRAGDANGDNFTDISDLLILIAHYNAIRPDANYLEAADFNADGNNDITDLLLLIGNYNRQGD